MKALLSALLVLSVQVWADESWVGRSAYRLPGVSYMSYLRAAAVSPTARPFPFMTPVDQAKEFQKAQLPAAAVWPSVQYMQERFEAMRNLRFLKVQSKPDFLRRISWLYPDDGCFARAQLGVRNVFNDGAVAPAKVFVFGDLNVRTPNSPYGSVTWWYHVAPIVEVDGQKYVLDPAIHAAAPLTLEDWLARQSSRPESLRVSICSSGSYHPYDDCGRVIDAKEAQAESEQGWFLNLEWNRLVELNRDPERELGDNPPWL